MAWENPVTTWGQAGQTVPGAGDFNRIEGNTQYLKDEVDLHKEDETAHITPDERNDWNSKAAGSHNHDASDINTGTLPVARGGTGGTTAATARTNLGVAQTRVYNGKLQYYDGGWKDVGGGGFSDVDFIRGSLNGNSQYQTVINYIGKGTLLDVGLLGQYRNDGIDLRIKVDGAVIDDGKWHTEFAAGGAGISMLFNLKFNSSVNIEMKSAGGYTTGITVLATVGVS